MDAERQTDALEEALRGVLDRFRHEWDLDYSSVVGTLMHLAVEVAVEAVLLAYDGEEEEDGE